MIYTSICKYFSQGNTPRSIKGQLFLSPPPSPAPILYWGSFNPNCQVLPRFTSYLEGRSIQIAKCCHLLPVKHNENKCFTGSIGPLPGLKRPISRFKGHIEWLRGPIRDLRMTFRKYRGLKRFFFLYFEGAHLSRRPFYGLFYPVGRVLAASLTSVLSEWLQEAAVTNETLSAKYAASV